MYNSNTSNLVYTCIERWSHYMASRFEQSRRFLAVWSFQKQYHQSVPAGWAFMVVELPEGSNSNTYRPVFTYLWVLSQFCSSLIVFLIFNLQ